MHYRLVVTLAGFGVSVMEMDHTRGVKEIFPNSLNKSNANDGGCKCTVACQLRERRFGSNVQAIEPKYEKHPYPLRTTGVEICE